MYHAFFFHNSDLAKRLRDQNEENDNALIGEFDGFSYASWRRNAIFRSLEDMCVDGLLTEEEYRECMNVWKPHFKLKGERLCILLNLHTMKAMQIT